MSSPIAAVAAAVVALVLGAGISAQPHLPSAAAEPVPSQIAARLPAELPVPVPEPREATPVQPAPAEVDCRKAKCLALTFDDGPVRQTATVLDALKARGARATFFVLGTMATRDPGALRRMVAEGHAIGNHSWNHPQFFTMDAAAVRTQIRATNAAVAKATGKAPTMMRPPFGEQNAAIRRTIGSFGDSVVLWNVDTEDWKHQHRNPGWVTKYVVRHAKRGAIVLLHDIRPTTRAAVPGIVAQLQEKGYTLVTVPELLRGRLKPGRVYLHG